MLGIDTNVVVRLVVADDGEQTRRARKLIDQALDRDESVLVSLERYFIGRTARAGFRIASLQQVIGRWDAARRRPSTAKQDGSPVLCRSDGRGRRITRQQPAASSGPKNAAATGLLRHGGAP